MAANYSNDSFAGTVNVTGKLTANSMVCTPYVRAVTDTGPMLGLDTTRVIAVNRTAVGNVPFVVQGMAAQTGDLQQWQDSGGVVLAKVSAGGNIQAPYFMSLTQVGPYFIMTPTGTTLQNQSTASNVALTVKGMAAQTGDLQQWQNSAGAALAKVSAAGAITGTAFSAAARVKSVAAAVKTTAVVNLPEPATAAQVATATLDRAGYLLRPPGSAGYAVTTTGAVQYAAASITGDLEVTVRLAPAAAWVGTLRTIASKYVVSSNLRGWRFDISALGKLQLGWTSDGAAGTFFQTTSTAVVPFTGTEIGWVRVTLDVNNGAAGSDSKFYTSTDGSTWTQLGTTVVGPATAIFNNAAVPYQLGAFDSAAQPCAGDYLWAEIRNGIGGTNLVPTDPGAWTAVAGATVYPLVAPVAGSSLAVALTQDGTGSRTVTWPSNVKWPGGVAPTLSTAAAAVDYLAFDCVDGANWLGRTVGMAYT